MRQRSRQNLGDELTSEVRKLALRGALRPGSRINEVHLSRRLGVSRTPLREGLIRLAMAGFIDSEPRRGFFVRDLTVEEFAQLYPIRALLDPEALRIAGIPDETRCKKLARLNREIEKAADPLRAIDLDDRWHRLLVSGCENRVLLEQIEHLMIRTRRYECAYFRNARHIGVAVDEHAQILESLEQGDLRGACRALRRNMISGHESIESWLRSRAESEEAKDTELR